jgi:Kef-type K+ transport system membrane component KefB
MDLQSALVLAAISQTEYRSLVLVLAAASAAALLSRLHRRLVLPTVVVEIVLGILIGPEGLDIAQVDTYITFLANLGLAFLFFFAGLEVIEKHVPRQAVVRGSAGWAISILLGLALAFFGATGLPLIVAIVGVAGERGAIADSVGAALIGAGMVSVLLFPLLGVRIAGEREPSVPAAPAIAEAGDEY